MKYSLITILLFFVVGIHSIGHSQFTEMNHPFTDSLWRVSPGLGNVLVAGKEGLLVSTNSGVSFAEVSSFSNINSSNVYQQTVFTDVFIYSNDYWACGTDTVNNKGVIFHAYDNQNWSIVLSSSQTTKFNVVNRGSSNWIFFIGENYYYQYSGFNPNSILSQGAINPSSNENYTEVWPCGYNCLVALSDNFITTINLSNNTRSHTPNNFGFKRMDKKAGINTDNLLMSETQLYSASPPFQSNLTNIPAINNMNDFNAILCMNGATYVGTKEGILLQRYYAGEFFEQIIGTEQYDVLDLSNYNSLYIFGVTADGKILRTTTHTYNTYPLAMYKHEVNYCVGDTNIVENLGDPNNSYSWYIDNNLVSTAFDLTHVFTSPGVIQIKLKVDKGTYSDSITKIVFVTTPPNPTIQHSVDQQIICHEGKATFTFNTEVNRSYALMREGRASPDTVFTGTGNDLISSQLITDTSAFSLIANYPSQNCFQEYLLDTIIVQKPKALFHSTFLNQDQGKEIYLYDNSEYSDTTEWLINPNVLHNTDNEYVTDYDTPGFKDLGLIAKTDFGCRDTLYRNNLIYIVDTSLYHDGCFDLEFYQTDSYYSQHSPLELVSDMIMDDDENIYIVGGSDYLILPTTHGQTPDTLSNLGFYLAQYNKYGVLKWITTLGLEVEDAIYNSYYRSRVFKIKRNAVNDLVLDVGQTNGTTLNYKSNDGRKLEYSLGSNVTGGSDAFLHVDHLGRLKKLIKHINYSSSGVSADVDDLGNAYVLTNNDLSFLQVHAIDSTYNISVPVDHRFGKIKDDGTVVWSVKTDLSSSSYNRLEQIKVQSDRVYIRGNNFSGTLYSSDGTTTISTGNTNTVFKNVIACYDTSGVLQWHYLLPSETNGKTDMSIDEEGNAYLSFSHYFGDSIQIADQLGTSINIPGRLVKFDKNGNLDYNYLVIKSGNNYFNHKTTDLETWGNEVGLMANTTTAPGTQQLAIAVNSYYTKIFPASLQELYYEVRYDENGVLLDTIFNGHELNLDPVNGFFKPKQMAFDDNNSFYAMEVLGATGFKWRNIQYPQNTSQNFQRTWLVTNSINQNCNSNNLHVELSDTIVCAIDSTTINIVNNISSLNQFHANNVFTLHTSSNSIFGVNNSTLIDTISTGNNLNNIVWPFDYSQSQEDTIWLQVQSSFPQLHSIPFYIVLSTIPNDVTYPVFGCLNETIELNPGIGSNYIWTDESNTVVSNADSLEITIQNNLTTYEVDIIGNCGFGWTETYNVSPSTYTIQNTDIVYLCKDFESPVSFNSNYAYSMNGYSSIIDSSNYNFNFTNDTLIYYSLEDSLGCSFYDSVQFFINPSQYTTPNTDSIFLCNNNETALSFIPGFTYTMSGYSSMIDNSNYTFQFMNDTIINYSLEDNSGCLYDDSIQFILYPSLYSYQNTDSITQCIGVESIINFVPEYDYTISEYSSIIDSLNYGFTFSIDTLIEYSIVDSLGCSYSDTLLFNIHPILYYYQNIDQVELCPDAEISVNFEPGYSYSMNGNSSVLDSLTYGFTFSNNAIINYSLTDSLGCSYNDSIVFLTHPTQDPVLSLIGPPWEIITPPSFINYNWNSTSDFNTGGSQNSIFPTESGEFFVEVTDSNGCSTSNSYIFSNVSTKEHQSSPLSFYPNPVSNKLMITGDKGQYRKVKIISIEGRLIYSSIFENTIDTSNLKTGTYLIIVSSDKKQVIHRFIRK